LQELLLCTCGSEIERTTNRRKIYCDECRIALRKKNRRGSRATYQSIQKKLLYVLKTQNCNLGMLLAFTGSSPNSLSQQITQLRKKGHLINKIDHEYYHYSGMEKNSF